MAAAGGKRHDHFDRMIGIISSRGRQCQRANRQLQGGNSKEHLQDYPYRVS